MPRVKRSTKRRDRRRKVLGRAKGYFGAKSRNYRTAKEAVEKSLLYAYRDRRAKKRELRSLWIIRIKAGGTEPVKDADGTVDLPHLRNAIARIPQADIPADKKTALQERARKMLEEANSEKAGRRLNRDKVGFLKGVSERMHEMMKALAEFYNLYLIKGMTPGEVLAKHPEWKPLWTDAPDGQYGRPAAFYQQLQALNLGEAWQKTNAPVLVIRGSADNIMSRADAAAIAQIVNQVHPGYARYLEIEGMTHGFSVAGKFYDPIVTTVLDWMKQQLAAK